jgi:inorganic pyrophosphatase/exopolyphosphatase
VNLRIDMLLNPQNYPEGTAPTWETIKDPDEEGKLFSVEDLVNMKPFKMEDLNTTIAFRANDKVQRACQRIKERAGDTYDIMSDLYRDVFMLGLIFMTQRLEDILGGEMVIERAMSRARLVKEIFDQVRRLGELLYNENESDRRADYLAFIEMVRKKPVKIQEHYIAAMEGNPMLAELRKRQMEQARHEESPE